MLRSQIRSILFFIIPTAAFGATPVTVTLTDQIAQPYINSSTTTYNILVDGGNPKSTTINLYNYNSLDVNSLTIDSGDTVRLLYDLQFPVAGSIHADTLQTNGTLYNAAYGLIQAQSIVTNGTLYNAGALVSSQGAPFTGTGNIYITPISLDDTGWMYAATGTTIIAAGLHVLGSGTPWNGSLPAPPIYVAAIGRSDSPLVNQGLIAATTDRPADSQFGAARPGIFSLFGTTITNYGTLSASSNVLLQIHGSLISAPSSHIVIQAPNLYALGTPSISIDGDLDLSAPDDYLDILPTFHVYLPDLTYFVINYIGTLTGAFDHTPPNIQIDYSTPGTIIATGIPEPSLTLISMPWLLLRRRGTF